MIALASYGIFFLLLITAGIVKHRLPRQLLLLTASYIFYATWGLWFLAVLVISSVLNFGYGIVIRRKPTAGYLWAGVVGNILLLSVFKYSHVVTQIAGPNSQITSLFSGIAMPIGISFWTFQALSYLFDVYRQEEVDPSLLEFCLYMAFWPTVVMGPICRLPNILPQLREVTPFSSANVLLGVRRIITGLFMKFALAQIISSGFSTGTGVVAGFDRVGKYSGIDVWFLAIGFGFQLFLDFAGYSNIVIGAARIFGFRLEENFDSPYLASTPSEFWTRWHMSLSSWIRDYVFIPIASARREAWWRYFALLLAMTLFGLWHGAKSTFVLWGVYQGVLLILHRIIQQFRRNSTLSISDAWVTPLSSVVTFLSICFGWVLFRANSLEQVLAMLRATLSPSTYLHPGLTSSFYALIAVVVIGYLWFETMGRTLWHRVRLGLTPNWNQDVLAKWGVSREFLTFVSFIPAVFILFFIMLIIHSESDGITPFVYTLF